MYPPIAAACRTIIRSDSGRGRIDVFHAFEFHYQGQRATLGAGRHGCLSAGTRCVSLRAEIASNICARFRTRDRAIVTEPFADKHHVRVGRSCCIFRSAREFGPLTVAGIYYDYSSDRGFVILRSLARC